MTAPPSEKQWGEMLAGLAERPPDHAPEALAGWLAQRQKCVAALQAVDATTVPEQFKARFRTIVEQVMSADQALVSELRSQQHALHEQLTGALQRKTALRGYRHDKAVQGRTTSLKA